MKYISKCNSILNNLFANTSTSFMLIYKPDEYI